MKIHLIKFKCIQDMFIKSRLYKRPSSRTKVWAGVRSRAEKQECRATAVESRAIPMFYLMIARLKAWVARFLV